MGFPAVAQVRHTRPTKGRKHVEVVYLIRSLPMPQEQPEQFATWIHDHWGSRIALLGARYRLRRGTPAAHRQRSRDHSCATHLDHQPHPPPPLLPRPQRSITTATSPLARQPGRAIKPITHPTLHVNRLRPPSAEAIFL